MESSIVIINHPQYKMTCCIFCSHQTELESANKDPTLAFFSTFPFCEASDVAISQFRFIVPLLFCHGALIEVLESLDL